MQIDPYIEGYIQYVFHKHKTPNKYEDLDLYLESEFKFAATEYDFAEWLGNTNKKKLLTPDNMCSMIHIVQRHYGKDTAILFLEITPDTLLIEYAYCIIYYMPVEKIREIIEQ
jgi:hypothetical protein